MNLGDTVVRNPRYRWCLCMSHAGCWCRGAGPFTIEAVDRTGKSQSGLLVKAARDGHVLEFLDASYFLEADGKEISLPGQADDLFPPQKSPGNRTVRH